MPSLANVAEIPLVFQDKVFIDSNPDSRNYILRKDPSWPLPVVVMATAVSSAIAVDRSFAAVA